MYGDFFPMQIIVTSKLSKSENFWLRYLTDDLQSVEEANNILDKYEGHQKENLYKSVMNIIVNANKGVFKEATEMCEALLELMQEKLEEKLEEREKVGREDGRIEGEKAGERNVKIRLIQTKLSKGKTVEAIAEDLEDSVDNILELMKEMN